MAILAENRIFLQNFQIFAIFACLKGFVGRGGLAAAIAGSVFTSPPATHILAALKTVENPVGILIFVINYTGDRLNFGIATERAPLLGIKCPIRSVTIGEDCALTSVDRSAGRRGLAGCVLLMKIAGAMAENRCSLDEIGAFLEQKLLGNMGRFSANFYFYFYILKISIIIEIKIFKNYFSLKLKEFYGFSKIFFGLRFTKLGGI